MHRQPRPIRSLVVPLAVMGVAMSLPAGLDAAAPRMAEQVVQSTVDRAETIVDSFAESARDLVGVQIALIGSSHVIPVDPADSFAVVSPAAPCPGPRSLPQRHLIDLPPPA